MFVTFENPHFSPSIMRVAFSLFLIMAVVGVKSLTVDGGKKSEKIIKSARWTHTNLLLTSNWIEDL